MDESIRLRKSEDEEEGVSSAVLPTTRPAVNTIGWTALTVTLSTAATAV